MRRGVKKKKKICHAFHLFVVLYIERQNSPSLLSRVFSAILLAEDEAASFDVPAGWAGEYYPSYMPEGYDVVFVSQNPHTPNIVLRNSDGNSIECSELYFGSSSTINTEDAEITYVDFHGTSAMLAMRSDYGFLVWQGENRYFILMSDLPAEEIIRIGNSVRKIK